MPDNFPSELFDSSMLFADSPIDVTASLSEVRKKGLAAIERRYLQELLRRNNGKINASALQAGVGTRQLNKLMHKYNLEKSTSMG